MMRMFHLGTIQCLKRWLFLFFIVCRFERTGLPDLATGRNMSILLAPISSHLLPKRYTTTSSCLNSKLIHEFKARNEAAIRRKILEKVGTFTTHPGFNVSDNEDIEESTDSIDPDLVVTTASDADSSGDSGKVVASSIDGEDDVVDVTMKDSNSVRESIEKDIDTTNSPQGKTA